MPVSSDNFRVFIPVIVLSPQNKQERTLWTGIISGSEIFLCIAGNILIEDKKSLKYSYKNEEIRSFRLTSLIKQENDRIYEVLLNLGFEKVNLADCIETKVKYFCGTSTTHKILKYAKN